MKKLGLVFFIFLLLGGAAYLWYHRYDYFFQGQIEQEGDNGLVDEEKNEISGDQGNDQFEIDQENSENPNEQEEPLTIDYDSIELTDKPLEDIVSEDCQDRCQSKKDDKEEYLYCREICGLSEETVDLDDCETLSGIDRDSCFKSKAITEKDFQYCEKISDKNMKEACENRVSEEILDIN